MGLFDTGKRGREDCSLETRDQLHTDLRALRKEISRLKAEGTTDEDRQKRSALRLGIRGIKNELNKCGSLKDEEIGEY